MNIQIQKVAVILIAFMFFFGCATRKIQVVHVPVAPGMSKEEVKAAEQSAIRLVEDRERQARYRANLQLRCPNPADEQNVRIHPIAGDTGVLRSRQYIKVLTTNTSPYPVRIDLPGMGTYVENLTFGCTINLVRRLDVYRYGDENYLTFFFEVTAYNKEGQIYKDRSETFNLSAFGGNSSRGASWIIKISPLDMGTRRVEENRRY